MLKIIAISDKQDTAIDRLAKGLIPYFDNIDYKVLDYHPKRASSEQMQALEAEARDADLIDYQYFKTAQKVREAHPWIKEKKSILSMYNPYSIEEANWNDYDLVTGCNKYIYDRLGKITESPVEYVPLTVDTDFWTYNLDWKADQNAMMNVIMVANRVEGKKGILPVAQACKKLGINMDLVGAISDANYFNEIIETGVVRFHEQISDEELKKLYHRSTVFVCNSVDGFESGTLPLLEAMLCGTPVISRNVGHTPDIFNGENMILNEKEPEDVDNLVELIHNLISDKNKMNEIRDKAFSSAKVRSNQRRAYLLQKLYRQVLHPNSTPVSIVVPIYDKPEIIRKCLNAVAQQTYKNIELIVADDSLGEDNKALVDNFARFVSFPVRYLKTSQIIIDEEHPKGYKDYGLARGRNMATNQATGEIMVYIDQRQVPEPEAVEQFVEKIKPNYWLYGNKGYKKEFVENFSAVYRQDVLRINGFNERINLYGGMSEELRKRMRASGISTEFVENAKAIPTGKSSNRNRKRSEIIRMKNLIYKMNFPE